MKFKQSLFKMITVIAGLLQVGGMDLGPADEGV